jgi:hypothetical protein
MSVCTKKSCQGFLLPESTSVRSYVRSLRGGKWLVGPRSTSSAIASAFIWLVHTGHCHGVNCAVTDESDQRRARFWLPFFARRVAMHRVTSDCRACWRAASTETFALYVIVARCGRAPKTFPKRVHERACSRLERIT